MNTIFAEYNMYYNSIDIYTSARYMLRIDCNKTEKDEPLEYVNLHLDGTMQMWVDAEDSLDIK